MRDLRAHSPVNKLVVWTPLDLQNVYTASCYGMDAAAAAAADADVVHGRNNGVDDSALS